MLSVEKTELGRARFLSASQFRVRLYQKSPTEQWSAQTSSSITRFADSGVSPVTFSTDLSLELVVLDVAGPVLQLGAFLFNAAH